MKDKLVFNGHDLGALMSVSSVSRSVAPSYNFTQTTVAGHNGAYVVNGGLEVLEIDVIGNLRAHNIEHVTRQRRLLASMLQTSDVAKLILPDEIDKYYMAYYKGGADLSRNAHRPQVTLTFLCPDPVAFGQEREQTITTTQTVVNAGGTYKSYPTITATPASGQTYWQIMNVTTGEFVKVFANFTGAQTITLDTEKQRAIINKSDVAVDINSDFFAIEGAQTLKVSSGSATMTWCERWL